MGGSRIDPGQIPAPTTDPIMLNAAAGWLRTDGANITSAGTDIKTAWGALSTCYKAPEAEAVYLAMNFVHTETTKVGSDLQIIAGALAQFAADAGPAAATLRQTKIDAQAFHDRTDGDDDWDHSHDNINENNRYVHAVDTAVVQYMAAERACYNTIQGLIGGTLLHAGDSSKDSRAYGVDSIPDDAQTPWGAAATYEKGCGEAMGDYFSSAASSPGGLTQKLTMDIAEGAWEALKGLVVGLGDLVGFGGLDKMGQSWMGIATLLGAMGPEKQQEALTAAGKSLVAWDEWKTNPGKAFGMAFTNIGTFFIPVGGEVAGATKVAVDGAKAGEVAADAGKVADAGKAADIANVLDKLPPEIKAAVIDLTKNGKLAIDPATGLPKLADLENILKTKFPNSLGDVSSSIKTLDDWVKDHPGGGGHDPLPGGHDPATPGGSHDPTTPGGSHDPATPGGSDPSNPTSPTSPTTPTSPGSHPPAAPIADDATKALARDNPTVVAQVDQLKLHVQPELKSAAVDAWATANDTSASRWVDWSDSHGGRTPTAQTVANWAHHDFADTIVADPKLVPPGSGYRIRSEASFDVSGGPAAYGSKGSIRPDIVLERELPNGNYEVVQAYDFKTGNAKIAAQWARELAKRTGVDLSNIEAVTPH